MTFPLEIIDGILDTLVNDSSNPHIYVSPEQTKFIAWYNSVIVLIDGITAQTPHGTSEFNSKQ